MTSAHIFFIPLVLLVGVVLGIALGRRSAFVQIEQEKLRLEREAKRKARREERTSSAADTTPDSERRAES